MATCAPLPGFFLGIPQVIGGCEAISAGSVTLNSQQTNAACSLPKNTVYSLVSTSTDKIVGTATQLSANASSTPVSIPGVDWTYTATTGGYYSLQYKGRRVVADLTNSGGRLILAPPTGTLPSVEVAYRDTTQAVMVARVTGNYTVNPPSSNLVPSFSNAPGSMTGVFVLGCQLSQINGETVIVPLLLSQDAYTTSGSLPGSAATVVWTVGDVTASNTIITYPLSTDCALNRANTIPPPAGSSWATVLLGLIALVVLGIAIFVAMSLRRTEPVQDPRAPYVAAALAAYKK